ncbi:MAG: hypothetical protein JJU29_10290 [Verrucomicrobia bacterium]|nr:hypothetical protein [Verrucomicrobiota bacterium]MCH8513436.1 hypothetical protein [Kiritimatiellia bacterium]
MKVLAAILTTLLWATFAQGGLLGDACCCTPPADPPACCAEPEPEPNHNCPCAIQAPEEVPAQPVTLQFAPRDHQTALYTLPSQEIALFRPSEKIFSSFPTLGNAPPRTSAAFLQIWRC